MKLKLVTYFRRMEKPALHFERCCVIGRYLRVGVVNVEKRNSCFRCADSTKVK